MKSIKKPTERFLIVLGVVVFLLSVVDIAPVIAGYGSRAGNPKDNQRYELNRKGKCVWSRCASTSGAT